MPIDLPANTVLRKLNSSGTFALDRVIYMVGGRHELQHVLVDRNDYQITVIDLNGEILLETSRPGPGIAYVGKDHGTRPNRPGPSPKS